LTFSRGILWVVAITRRTRAWIVSDIGGLLKTTVLPERVVEARGGNCFSKVKPRA
jgi:hypothetical protein